MPQNYKVLGQNNPPASGLTNLYTVPSSSQAVCSTLAVCNLSNATSYRIAVIPSGETISNKHYIAYNNTINTTDSIMISIGMTLNNGDSVDVYTPSNSGLAFTLFGSEIT